MAILSNNVVRALAACALIAALGACASFRAPEPISVAEIVRMNKSGVAPEVIIDRIHQTRSIYPLTASDFARLHAQGVPDSVLNYMQQTYLDEVARQQAARDFVYDGYPFGRPWW